MEFTPTQRESIDTFMAVTGSSDQSMAVAVLNRHNWDVSVSYCERSSESNNRRVHLQ